MKILSVESAKLHLFCVKTDEQEGMIDKTVWSHSGLNVGDSLSEQEWEALKESSEEFRAKEKALYYLSLRDYGSGELIKKLVAAGVERERAERAVARLVQSGLIDDERYAGMLARDLASRKLYPKRRVAMALREKGFDSETIEAVICELPEEEEQQALELLRKKRYNEKSDGKLREKALAMLARYGFSYAVSKKALALREEELDEENT